MKKMQITVASSKEDKKAKKKLAKLAKEVKKENKDVFTGILLGVGICTFLALIILGISAL